MSLPSHSDRRATGIGPETAAVLWSEGLFRQFDNRRQVAAYAGLAPTPWQSGSIDHEQGVARKLLIPLWRYTTAGVVIEGAVMKAALATI